MYTNNSKKKYIQSSQRAGFTLVELLVVIAIIAGLAAISSPIIVQQISKSRSAQAVTNGRDIHIALRDQSIRTADTLSARRGNANLSMAESFARGFIRDEKPFYVKGVPGAIQGDGNISGLSFNQTTGVLVQGSALETNSNVFSYFDKNGVGLNLITELPSSPILATPLVTAGAWNTTVYHQKSFNNQAIIVRVDGSVSTILLNELTGLPLDAADVTIIDRSGTDITSTFISELPDFTVPLT